MMDTTAILSQSDLKSDKYKRIDDLINAALNRDETLAELNAGGTPGQVIIIGTNVILIFFPEQERRAIYRYQRETSPPGVMSIATEAAKSLKSAARAAMNGEGIKCSIEVENNRLEACAKCPQFDNGRCMTIKREDGSELKGCGCMMKIKAKLVSATCPQGKWNA